MPVNVNGDVEGAAKPKVAKKAASKATFNSVKFAKKFGVNIMCEKRGKKPAYVTPFGSAGQFVDVVLTRRTVPKECARLALTFCMPWGSGDVPPPLNVVRYVRKIARTFHKVEAYCQANDHQYVTRRLQGSHEQTFVNAYRRVFNLNETATNDSRANSNMTSGENRKILSLVKQGEKIRSFFGKNFVDLISD